MDKVQPRIFRTWDPRLGRMVWACSDLSPGRWGLGVSQQARYDWRQAHMWCAARNLKQKEGPTAQYEDDRYRKE